MGGGFWYGVVDGDNKAFILMFFVIKKFLGCVGDDSSFVVPCTPFFNAEHQKNLPTLEEV